MTLVALAANGTSALATAAPPPATPPDAPAVWRPAAQVNRTPTGTTQPDQPWRAPRTRDARPPEASTQQANSPVCPAPKTELMDWHQLSDGLQVGVNLATGELRVVARDLIIPGTGMALAVDHVYEGNTYSSTLGGWMLGTGPDIGLATEWEDDTGYLELWGAGGCSWEFPKHADGGYGRATGLAASLQKLANGSYSLTFDVTGQTWSFTSTGWLSAQADRNGNTITFRYTNQGGIASITDTQGRVTTFTNVPDGVLGADMIASITDPSGLTFGDFTYVQPHPNSFPMLGSFTDRAGNEVRLGYSTDGTASLTSITDTRGGVHQIGSDSSEVTAITSPSANGPVTTRYDVNRPARTTLVTDPNGHVTKHEFSSAGENPIKATDALGHVQSATWTANGDLQSVTDGLNQKVTLNYDSLNNPTGTVLPTGAATSVGYTSATLPYLPTQLTDANGDRYTRHYDAAGNLTSVRSATLNVDLATYQYNDPQGTVRRSTDARGQVTTYEYDVAGNLIKVVPPLPARPTSYTYDSLSRVASVTDGNGVRLDYDYDRLDHVLQVRRGAQVLQTNTYDAAGNLTATQAGGVIRTLTYDGRNKLTKVTRGSEVVTYTYDNTGNLRTMNDPAGTTTYGYDAADRLTSLADPFGQTTTFGYDNADNRTSITFPGAGGQTNTYDNSGRLTGLSVKNTAGTELLRAAYNYTTASGADSDRLQTKTVGSVITTYGYDSLGHLNKAGVPTFAVDNADNITNLAGTPLAVNAADQLTSVGSATLTHDNAGNPTSLSSPATAYEYSSTNQLVRTSSAGTQTFSAAYDTSDQTQPRTITETVAGATTTRVLTHTALGITGVVDNGTRTSVTRDPQGRLVTEKAGAARYNLITDNQGSVLAMLNTTGQLVATYTYTPYGTVSTSGTAAGANPFRYLGGYTLANGMVLFGFRYYVPSWGRFLGPDPTSRERNRYAYAQSDPINNTDPRGDSLLKGIGQLFVAAGAAVAAAGGVATCAETGGIGCGVALASFGAGINAIAEADKEFREP